MTILGTDMLRGLLDDVELFRPVDRGINRGEDAVIRINEMVPDRAHDMPMLMFGTDAPVAPNVLAMLSLAGPLAAIETPEPLSDAAARSLSKILLAFWGLDVDLDLDIVQPGSASAAISALGCALRMGE